MAQGHPFIAKNKVRMHDTDMAGILYFPRQFRFAHDALEDFVESEGMNFNEIFSKEKFVFVIVHAEADYYIAVHVGDRLEIHLYVDRIGTTSFSLVYKIYREPNHELVGSAKTIHVSLNSDTREKIPIPEKLLESLKKYRITV
jgi:1,4-dihydroxy-2-naphthoyl-CoA hydrolase